MDKITFDICVATYKRPYLLNNLLISLQALKLKPEWALTIIVVDNDYRQTAKTIVNKYRSEQSIDILYLVEPKKGISQARNKALESASADFICFIDDDEVAAKDWLINLADCLYEHDADAVFGPAVKLLPDNAPAWVKNNSFYMHLNRAKGTVLEYGATNNVLLKKNSLGIPLHKFDVRYSLTGGEDTDFFYRLYLTGKKLIWCNDAYVYESVPRSRLSKKWYMLRHFRSGQCYFKTVIKKKKTAYQFIYLIKKAIHGFLIIFIIPFYLLINYNYFMALLGRFSLFLGEISAILPDYFMYKEYKK